MGLENTALSLLFFRVVTCVMSRAIFFFIFADKFYTGTRLIQATAPEIRRAGETRRAG